MKTQGGFLLCCFFMLLLSGCGGGGGGGGVVTSPPTPDPPDPPDPIIVPPPAPTVVISPPTPDPIIVPPMPAPTLAPVNYTVSAEYQASHIHKIIDTTAAYRQGFFGQGVTVAVIDGGVLSTHIDLTANLLPAANFFDRTQNFPIYDLPHGTHIAGIIGAELNGIGIHGVAPSVSILPIKLLARGNALQPGKISSAFAAALLSASIINNSWGWPSSVNGTYNGVRYRTREIPRFRPLWGGLGGYFRTIGERITAVLDNKDAIMVWSAGNERWQQNGSIYICTQPGASAAGEPCAADSSIPYTPVSIDDFINDFHLDGFGPLAGYSITSDSAGVVRNMPTEYPGITKYWLVVAASYHQPVPARLARFSNGCGVARFWCITAPGVSIYSTSVDTSTGEGTYQSGHGTSYSAPIVAGALALLRSRWNTMPMEVARAILLSTATDWGEPGADALYGWGLVNISNAFTVQSSMTINPTKTGDGGTRLLETQVVLPAQFSDVRAQLSGTSVAVKVFDGAYYNTKLSDVVVLKNAPSRRAGLAAADMLSPVAQQRTAGAFFAATDMDWKPQYAGINMALPGGLGKWQMRHDFCDSCRQSAWRWGDDFARAKPLFSQANESFLLSQQSGGGLRPFVSFSTKFGEGEEKTPYRQYGLRWNKDLAVGGKIRLGIATEASYIDEPNSFWGADFGALGKLGMRSRQGRLMLSVDSEKWQGGAMIEKLRGGTSNAEGGLLSRVSGLSAHGWGTFLQKRGIFGNDALRLMVRQEMRITNGSGRLRYRQASGDFTQAFYNNVAAAPAALKGTQTLETKTTEVDFSSKGRQIFALGYMFSTSSGGEVALSAEVEENANKAFSVQWQTRF